MAETREQQIKTGQYMLPTERQAEMLQSFGLEIVTGEIFDNEGNQSGFWYGIVEPDQIKEGVFQGEREDIPVEADIFSNKVTIRQKRQYKGFDASRTYLEDEDKTRVAIAVAVSAVMPRREDIERVNIDLQLANTSLPESKHILTALSELSDGELQKVAVALRLNQHILIKD